MVAELVLNGVRVKAKIKRLRLKYDPVIIEAIVKDFILDLRQCKYS